ncbi:MAG: hypothetical protein L6R38_001953 [Xanthoria sp. 2 TBL-2021]|nr:MAG: hypothetical protein L6R38_001953 [Xanthoria sp. 2 TBL-2021]
MPRRVHFVLLTRHNASLDVHLDLELGILRARHAPSFSAALERLVNRERIEGISEARAANRLKNGARAGRQATQIARLNSIDTAEVSLESSRHRAGTENRRAYSRKKTNRQIAVVVLWWEVPSVSASAILEPLREVEGNEGDEKQQCYDRGDCIRLA